MFLLFLKSCFCFACVLSVHAALLRTKHEVGVFDNGGRRRKRKEVKRPEWTRAVGPTSALFLMCLQTDK